MSRNKTLVKNIIIYGAGTSLAKLLSILLVGMYTAYILPADYGYYDFLVTTMSTLTPLITMQIIDALYRNLLDAKNDGDIQKTATCAFFVVICGIGLAMSVLVVVNLLIDLRFGWLLVPYTASTILFTFCQSSARGLRRNSVYAISGIAYAGVMLTANIALIVGLGMGAEALLISIILADVLGILYVELSVKVFRRVKLRTLNREMLREMLKYSMPLIPSAVTWWLLLLCSRWAIIHFIGEDANGIYAVASKFPALLMTVFGIFVLAWQENAITEYNAEDRGQYYTRMFGVYVRLLGASMLLLMPLTRGFVGLLIEEKFGEAWLYIPFLYMGSVFQALTNFLGTGYLGARKTKGAFVTSVIGVACGLGVAIGLMPHIGVQAAALGHMTAFLVMWLTRLFDTRKYTGIVLDLRVLFSLGALTAAYAYCYYLENIWVDGALFVLAAAVFLWLNRETLGLLLRFGLDTLKKHQKKPGA